MIATAENAFPKKFKNQYCAWYIDIKKDVKM
jgi:hypothetical protein